MMNKMKPALFGEFLININGLSGNAFSEWIFHPGMLFGSKLKWWKDEIQFRPSPHEGLDIVYFRDAHGNICLAPEMMKVPVMHKGVVIKISDDDFLGKSIYVIHKDIIQENGNILHSIYAHTQPCTNICAGSNLEAGDIICRVVDFTKTNAKMTHHIHISTVFLPENFPRKNMNWETMADTSQIILKDPLVFLDINYAIEEKIPGIESS